MEVSRLTKCSGCSSLVSIMPLKSSKTFSLSSFGEKLRGSCYVNALRSEGVIWGMSDLPGPKTPEGEVGLAARHWGAREGC